MAGVYTIDQDLLAYPTGIFTIYISHKNSSNYGKWKIQQTRECLWNLPTRICSTVFTQMSYGPITSAPLLHL